jgi:thymidylate synthase (FAD)
MVKIDVLDKGYVALVGVLGDDLAVVNAARASFEKASAAFTEKDARLIRYLAAHGHMSPFRHAVLSFEVKAPLMVARQWWRYHVSSAHTEGQDGWNEASRRYVTSEPEFYVPGAWRSAPAGKKQGSGEPLPEAVAACERALLEQHVETSLSLYKEALEAGVCAEQARGFLPAYFLYVSWRWTASLEGVAHLLKQRLAEDAQVEFQEYARAVLQLAEVQFPASLDAMLYQSIY